MTTTDTTRPEETPEEAEFNCAFEEAAVWMRLRQERGSLALLDSAPRLTTRDILENAEARKAVLSRIAELEDELARLQIKRCAQSLPAVDVKPEPGVEAAPSAAPDASKGRVIRRRLARDLLTPTIERAQREVSNPQDSAAVMAELERMARLPDGQRPAPLSGVNSGGVLWRDGGQLRKLTRKALGERLRRQRPAEAR